jgi:hypothetical protein
MEAADISVAVACALVVEAEPISAAAACVASVAVACAAAERISAVAAYDISAAAGCGTSAAAQAGTLVASLRLPGPPHGRFHPVAAETH